MFPFLIVDVELPQSREHERGLQPLGSSARKGEMAPMHLGNRGCNEKSEPKSFLANAFRKFAQRSEHLIGDGRSFVENAHLNDLVLTEDLNDNRAPRGKIRNRPDRILEEVHNHELQFKRIPLHQYLFVRKHGLYVDHLGQVPRMLQRLTDKPPYVDGLESRRFLSKMSAALCVSCSAADRASVHLGTSKFPIFIINLIPVR